MQGIDNGDVKVTGNSKKDVAKCFSYFDPTTEPIKLIIR